MKIERCNACGRPFSVYEYGLSGPGTKDRESVDCPHCMTTVRTDVVNGFFQTRALSPADEAAYNAAHPRASTDGRA